MALTDKIPPEWNAPGIEPPDSKKDTGFEADDLVPAGWLNWFMTGVSAFLQDAQENGASTAWVQEQINKIAIPLIDSNTSTSKTSAPTADALRRTVESMNEALGLKQNTVRLADNWLASSVLVNALPDAQGRVYPDGFSFFKVSSSAGAWPTSNGYVVTMRAGSGGFQLYFEMYTGNVQTDKTSRFWYRSKRDSNTFWQDFTRVATEADLALKMDAARPSNLLPNGSGQLGLTGWMVRAGTGWNAGNGVGPAPGEIFSSGSPPAGTNYYVESLLVKVAAGSTYNLSAEFYTPGMAAGTLFLHLQYSNGTASTYLNSGENDVWARRNLDFVIPSGVTWVTVRAAVKMQSSAAAKGFRRIQLTQGPGVQSWNNDADVRAASQRFWDGLGFGRLNDMVFPGRYQGVWQATQPNEPYAFTQSRRVELTVESSEDGGSLKQTLTYLIGEASGRIFWRASDTGGINWTRWFEQVEQWRSSNLIPNGGFSAGSAGWRAAGTGVTGWKFESSGYSFPGELNFQAANASGYQYVESDLISVATNEVYTHSAQMLANGVTANNQMYIEIVNESGGVITNVYAAPGDSWAFRSVTFTVPAGIGKIRARCVIGPGAGAGYKGFARCMLNQGRTPAAWNDDSAPRALFQLSNDVKTKVRGAIIGKGGTVADADGDGIPTGDELTAGVNSIRALKPGSVQPSFGGTPGSSTLLATFPAGISRIYEVPSMQSSVRYYTYSAEHHLALSDGTTFLKLVSTGTGYTCNGLYIDFVNKYALLLYHGTTGASRVFISIASLDLSKAISLYASAGNNPVYTMSFVTELFYA